jgi:hypothetical protein
MTDRKKPGLTFWATAVSVMLMAYPLSFGPVCWLGTHADLFEDDDLPVIYRPIGWLCYHSEVVEKGMFAYARLGMKRNKSLNIPIEDGYWMGL